MPQQGVMMQAQIDGFFLTATGDIRRRLSRFEFDPLDFQFSHVVRHSPKVNLAPQDSEDDQQRIIGHACADLFEKRPIRQ